MRVLVISAVMLLWYANAAMSQTIVKQFPLFSTTSGGGSQFDDSDVGKAMTICEKHRYVAPFIFDTSPPMQSYEYEEGWKACVAVRAKWDQTEPARLAKEAEEQEKRDKDFVTKIANQ